MFTGAYPISSFLQKVIDTSGLSRLGFVQALGYRNTAKGLRRLDEWLQYGGGDPGLLQRIADAFPVDPGELESALAETDEIHRRQQDEADREIEERERRRFRAFVWIVTEDGAHSFFSAMLERQAKVLWFRRGLMRLSKPEQMAAAQRRVRRHYRKSGRECPGFGRILRYRFADSFDTSVVLDVDGNVIEENGGRFLLPEVWLELRS